MRAIVIDPVARIVYEERFPLTHDFMQVIGRHIGTNALSISADPPRTAMFVDAIGYLREPARMAFWRPKGDGVANTMAGVGIIFGLTPEGRLTDAPDEVTAAGTLAHTEWVDDTIESTIERMEISKTDDGRFYPRVTRQTVWIKASAPDLYTEPGAPAATVAAEPPKAPAAPVAPSLADHPAAPSSAAAMMQAAAPVADPTSIWAINETADGRYRVSEYEVTAKGNLGEVLSRVIAPNLEDARTRIPADLTMTVAADDAPDDTLVETWA